MNHNAIYNTFYMTKLPYDYDTNKYDVCNLDILIIYLHVALICGT